MGKKAPLGPLCLNPHCGRSATVRGLCMPCYRVAQRHVEKKRTTWERLERAGKVRAAKTAGRIVAPATAWLLEEE